MAEKEQERRRIGIGLPFQVGSRLIKEGIFTRTQIIDFLKGIRRENGAINHDHPDIKDMLRHAKREKLDVVLVPDGKGISAKLGKLIADPYVKIAAGTVITTAVTAGAFGFFIRKHRR